MNFKSTTTLLCLLAIIPLNSARACSFCAIDPGPSLLKELDAADQAAFAELIQSADPAAEHPATEYRVTKVLKGGDVLKPGDVIRVPFYIQAPSGSIHLFFRNSESSQWRNPRGASSAAKEFISLAARLPEIDDEPAPEARVKRLAFMLPYLNSNDREIATSAYGEFAAAPDTAVRQLKPILNHRELMTWLSLDSLATPNRRLVFTLLAVAEHKEALPTIEAALDDRIESEKAADLDAIIAAYLTLTGPQGLDEIESRILTQADIPLELRRAAANALRYHVDNAEVLKQDEVIAKCRLLLSVPQTADYVISDLARWKDWDSLDAVLELQAQAEENSWLKQPIREYLKACPMPAARSALASFPR